MSLIITIIQLIIVLCVVAIVHEFGHFIIAKAFGITVNEFSIGFGKALWQKKFKGTVYSFRLFLLGGYVQLEGEEQESDDENSFSKKHPFKRILVLVAGVAFNFILAVCIMLGINFSSDTLTTKLQGLEPGNILYEAGLRDGDEITKIGNITTHIYQDIALYDDTNSDSVEISYISQGKHKSVVLKNVIKEKGSVGIYFDSNAIKDDGTIQPVIDIIEPGSVAESSGLKASDLIIEVNGVEVYTTEEVIKITSSNPEKEIEFTVLRDEKQEKIKLTPTSKKYVDLGITNVETEKTNLKYSWYKSVNTVIRVVDSYVDLFKGNVKLNQMSGIVGVGEMVSKTDGIIELLSLMATISLAIGMANIMPFPPLDGGKIVLVLVEWISRKKVSQKVELVLSSIGLMLLFALTIYVTIKDIIRVI